MGQAKTLDQTNFSLPGQVGFYKGKVRDVYDLGGSLMIVSTDRFSAFDRNLALIPHKGQILNQLSEWWFDQTKSLVKNHVISFPDPNVMWARKVKIIPIEMVVRGFMSGVTSTSMWSTYSEGQRDYGDFTLPDGLDKNHQLPYPVITPTTKSDEHDEPLTPNEVVERGIVTKDTWQQMQKLAIKLFKKGMSLADEAGLILVDTKYEFGIDERGELLLADEVHTPDSSRFWLKSSYEERLANGLEPENYDKEYLRLWFADKFDPYSDDSAPDVPEEVKIELFNRYKYVYENLSGKKFSSDAADLTKRIEQNIQSALEEQND